MDQAKRDEGRKESRRRAIERNKTVADRGPVKPGTYRKGTVTLAGRNYAEDDPCKAR